MGLQWSTGSHATDNVSPLCCGFSFPACRPGTEPRSVGLCAASLSARRQQAGPELLVCAPRRARHPAPDLSRVTLLNAHVSFLEAVGGVIRGSRGLRSYPYPPPQPPTLTSIAMLLYRLHVAVCSVEPAVSCLASRHTAESDAAPKSVKSVKP